MKHNQGSDGPGRKNNYFRRIAAKESAERRRCPRCQRKSALVMVDNHFTGTHVVSTTKCRWCDYIKAYVSEDYGSATK